jgi:sec-independent protein translocase protein TatA
MPPRIVFANGQVINPPTAATDIVFSQQSVYLVASQAAGQLTVFLLRRQSMFGLGTQELLIILVLVMIIFGAGKLPQVGGALGKGLRNFKKGMSDNEEEIEEGEVEELSQAEKDKKKDQQP